MSRRPKYKTLTFAEVLNEAAYVEETPFDLTPAERERMVAETERSRKAREDYDAKQRAGGRTRTSKYGPQGGRF